MKQTYLPVKVIYSKTCVKRSLSKRPNVGFQDQVSLNAGQNYCRMQSILQYFRPSLSCIGPLLNLSLGQYEIT